MLDHPEEEQAAADRTVGSKVNAIIEAAEEAAKEIRDRANLEAIEVLRQAELHAAARIEELTREAAQAKTEADQYARDMTEAADSYGTQHRRTVEEEARQLLAESEAKAKETLAAAQEKAEELESTVVQRHETLQREAKMLGFVAIFLGVLLAGSLLSRWLRRGMKRVRLSWVDRFLGAGFGVLRGWLICSVVYLALTAFPVKLEAVERATFAPVLLEGTRMISYLTSPELREEFLRGYEMIKELWRKKE